MDVRDDGARYLVTGGNGFVGRHLVRRLLDDGIAVRVLQRRRGTPPETGVEVALGDVRDIEALRGAVNGCETVIHLAARVHHIRVLDDKDKHEAITVDGTSHLWSAALEYGVTTFVYISSLAVYGAGDASLRDEDADCQPISAYGRAKLKAEQQLLGSAIGCAPRVVCIRPATVYGAGCKGLLPDMIRMIDRGLFLPPPLVNNRRSMVHVSDLVEAIVSAVRCAPRGASYIVTDGRPYSTRELYEMICRGLGKSIPRWHVPLGALKGLARVGDAIGRLRGRRFVFDSDALEKLTGNAWYSSEKIARELGYRPKVTFEDTLPEMIDWYRKTRA